MILKINRIVLLISMLTVSIIIFTGCWNYKEVDQLAIAAGAAVDKGEDGNMHITIEVVNIATNGQTTFEPVYIESHGSTFFEAVRRAITKEGKKIYWSHAKIIIISQEIAKEEVAKYLDFLYRDAETREDTWLLVSTEKTAKELLQSDAMLRPIVSFQLDETMRSQKSVSRFPLIELYEFFDRLFYKQVAPVLPTVRLAEEDGKKIPEIEGTAIFKDGKMIGTIDAYHTRCMLWLRDEVEGGLVVIRDVAGTGEDVVLEIFKSNSKITPLLEDEILKMKVDITLKVNIGEIGGTTDFISGAGLITLKAAAKEQIEKDIENLFLIVRDKYDADIFGFGRRIEMKLPDVWNQIKEDWDKYFAELELDVNVKVEIRGSATTRMPLKTGE